MNTRETKHKILIVDDTPTNITTLATLLKDTYSITIATSGEKAVQIVKSDPSFDLILLDIIMPEMDGYEVCSRLKKDETTKDIPVIFITAKTDAEDEAKGFELGAVDYITKPFNLIIVQARVKTHIQLKRYQKHLETLVKERTKGLDEAYLDTIKRLDMTVEHRDPNTGGHIKRVSLFVKIIAEKLELPASLVTALYQAAPMHDLGKVGIPDDILNKEGNFTEEEREVMNTHTTIGARIFENSRAKILNLAGEMALTHHEKWDGSGYPAGLKGDRIPLSGRIMALADIYDGLRSSRKYKDAMTHEKAADIILKGDDKVKPCHFDPDILAIFAKYPTLFSEAYDSVSD